MTPVYVLFFQRQRSPEAAMGNGALPGKRRGRKKKGSIEFKMAKTAAEADMVEEQQGGLTHELEGELENWLISSQGSKPRAAMGRVRKASVLVYKLIVFGKLVRRVAFFFPLGRR